LPVPLLDLWRTIMVTPTNFPIAQLTDGEKREGIRWYARGAHSYE